MDLDFDLDVFDFDADGCGPVLIILLVCGVVLGIATAVQENIFLALTIGFGLLGALFMALVVNDKKRNRKTEPFHIWSVITCLLIATGFGVKGSMVYQEDAAYEYALQEQEEAERHAQEAKAEAKAAKDQKEIGAWGRAKKWAFGEGKTK